MKLEMPSFKDSFLEFCWHLFVLVLKWALIGFMAVSIFISGYMWMKAPAVESREDLKKQWMIASKCETVYFIIVYNAPKRVYKCADGNLYLPDEIPPLKK